MHPARWFGTAGAGTWTALTVLGLLCVAAAPAGAKAPKAWPPVEGKGQLYVHFGEEHINDADGATLLPTVVRESARYRPNLVTMSGDKVADGGEPGALQLWADVMEIYDRKGIPWFAAVGNHDRDVDPATVTFPPGSIEPYRPFFADRPYPMGDAAGYDDPQIRPRVREAADPDGASSHYFADYGNVRWIFIDNSCWEIDLCDMYQNPSGQNLGGHEPQFAFLARVATEASDQGKLVFVVTHMPTRDPADQTYREPVQVMHTMGLKGFATDDNEQFEVVAKDSGVDAVFVAHIKGQFLYEGEGGIPYFIDGGAGGELYTTGPVGTDHGYWHGFRLVRVRGSGFRTDVVPIFVPGGIRIAGSQELERGATQTFEAFGRQPVFNDPAKVPALELRDPDPIPRSGVASSALIADLAPWIAPLGALALLLASARLAAMPSTRRRIAVPAMAVAVGALGWAGISAAQQSEPTSTPVESLPNPSRIWTTSNPLVLRPVPSASDDPRRERRTQTADGRFRAVCPGRARLTITSGFESASTRIGVPSARGRIVRSIERGVRVVRAGNRRTLARVRLAQPARVMAKVTRNGRKVARLKRACVKRNAEITWNARRGRRAAAPGRYRVSIKVLSDRKPIKRSFGFTVED